MSFKKNTSTTITFGLVNVTDGSDVTTGTPVGYYSLDGGIQSTIADTTPVHLGVGQWTLDLTSAEMNGDVVGLAFTHPSAITVHFTIKTETKLTSDLNDVAATDIVSAGAITTLSGAVVNVDLVNTTTTNTDMRGTDSANTVAPDNASIASILADTNELQLNQGNWLTATGFSTHTAADVWTSTTRALTDKANFTISGTKTTLDSLNDFNSATDTVATVTNIINLPTAPANWITASSIAASALDGKGDWNIGKTGYSLTQAFPTNFSNMNIDVSGNTNSFVQGYLSTAITETTAGRIAANFDTFFENGDAVATKIVNDVGTAVSGGGEFTATEKNQIRFRLGIDGTTTTPTASPDIAQKSDITALNNFNPATDTVANVTLVATTTTNTDMVSAAPSVASIADAVWDEAQSGHTTVGTFGSFLDAKVSAAGGGGGASAADIWSYATRELTSGNNIVLAKGTGVTGFNDVAATDIVTGGAITTSGGAVSNVTLVDTTTTNTDMRGTDSAMLASSYTAPDNVSITSILADTNELQSNQGNWLTATGFNTVAPDNASIAAILTDTSITIPTQISGLNDLSAADVWTTQLTESYAADGAAPTATQSLMLTQQFLSDFDITGTSYNVKRLDGTNTAATFTLNDAANPTSITRS